MSKHEITHYFSNSGSRNEVRMRVIDELLNEEPGKGNAILASHYIYYVETLSDGRRVFLKRPAFLHNGFDFVVCVENMNYANPGERARNNPKHEDILHDLETKYFDQPDEYNKLYALLYKVLNCQEVSEEEMKQLNFKSGLPVDHILKVIKWLFIEQDIRYWNYSGRYKLWTEILKIGGRLF